MRRQTRAASGRLELVIVAVAVTIVLVTANATRYYILSIDFARASMGVMQGVVYFDIYASARVHESVYPAFRVVPFGAPPVQLAWMPNIAKSTNGDVGAILPLWIVLVMIIVAGIVAALLRRTKPGWSRAGCCRCGYCLTGLAGRRCPECGEEVYP
ncbi:MAG: hypothetical protein IPM64_11460 [Phycisphaerales bacterium]|nr:hypothetical protein [Phycisphaerales bacterium]